MPLDYISKTEAERISGFKLDGRRKYFIWNDEVCVSSHYTDTCSGCYGDGCSWCGGHGVSRSSTPVPIKYLSFKKVDTNEENKISN